MSYQPRSSNHSDNDDDHRNRRLYSPYQDLGVPVQTLYKLPTSLEYLFQEESVAQRRSWGKNLTYTSIGYLGGAVLGAGKGLVEGVKASEAGDTMKLRVNRILNALGHAERKIGNRAGVIGLLYAGMESGMVAIRDKDDIINSVVAGLGTGALYKAAVGPRSTAIAEAIGGIAVEEMTVARGGGGGRRRWPWVEVEGGGGGRSTGGPTASRLVACATIDVEKNIESPYKKYKL